MVTLKKQNFEENKIKFEILKTKLKSILKADAPISHVGSTAIPNMLGKNIIDILVGAKDEGEFLKFSKLLTKNGYFKSEKSATSVYEFFASKKEETVAGDTHIHLCILNTDRYNEFLSLKNYLLKNPAVAKEYSNHKKEILKVYGNDRAEYRRIKSEYVKNLILKSKKESV